MALDSVLPHTGRIALPRVSVSKDLFPDPDSPFWNADSILFTE